MMPPPLKEKDRVRDLKEKGQGTGTVEYIQESYRWNIWVRWDNGKGPYPYTYNEQVQEIEKIGE